MCGPIETEALGRPRGTVRALLALILSTLTFLLASAVIIILIIRGQYSLAVSILSTLFGIIAVIITFYFASKSTKSVSDGYEKMMADKQSEIMFLAQENRDLNLNHPRGPNPYFQRDTVIEIGPQPE